MRLIRTLLLAAVVGLVAVAPLVGPAQGARPARGVGCRSGHTLFFDRGVRAFFITRYYSDPTGPAAYKITYACGRGWRRARELAYGSPYTRVSQFGFRIFGHRLGFVVYTEGFSNGSDTRVGWIDLRTGAVRTGEINTGENANPGDPAIPDSAVNYAIAPDGAVAVLGGPAPQEVAVMLPRRRGLGKPRVLFTAPGGGIDPRSIAIDARSVSWRTNKGRRTSVPR